MTGEAQHGADHQLGAVAFAGALHGGLENLETILQVLGIPFVAFTP